ncbi:hypothetical protein LTR27_012437 [Elasticomyces elasticus]|nr:hypothetical protein LTR27_012437 [Elasticomyces elasticus]
MSAWRSMEPKTFASAVTSARESNGDPEEQHDHMSGRLSDIVLNACLLVLPMLLLSATMLGLVFHYRIQHNSPINENLALASESDELGVYYITLNVTYLITIASWSSTLAPMLAASIVTLLSFPIGQKLLAASESGQQQRLLTPYQLVLTIGMLSGAGYGSLWNWMKYLVGWKKQRLAQGHALVHVACAVVTAVFLGFLVFLADTWLHFTTRPVNFSQVQPVGTMPSLGFGISADCISNMTAVANAVGKYPDGSWHSRICSVNPAATAVFLTNPTQALQVLNNVSEITMASTYLADLPYVYLTVPPSPSIAALDYSVETFAIQTQCRAISTECNLYPLYGSSTPYYCTPAFSGDVTETAFSMPHFTDATMTNNDTFDGIGNPYYFGWAALTNAAGGGNLTRSEDPGVVGTVHGGTAFVLGCNATMSDVIYDLVNGSISRFVTQRSNSSVANIASTVMAETVVPQLYLQQAASLAALSNSAQDLANELALAYSKVALSLFAEAVAPIPAIAAQQRSSFLVARVP